MAKESEEIRELSQRLDRLERQNRRLKKLLLIVPLVLVGMGAARFMESAVMTRTLIITDGDRNRIALGVNDQGETYINVWDKNGKRIRALAEERPEVPLIEDTIRTKKIIVTDGDDNRIALGVNHEGETFLNFWSQERRWVKALGEEQPR